MTRVGVRIASRHAALTVAMTLNRRFRRGGVSYCLPIKKTAALFFYVARTVNLCYNMFIMGNQFEVKESGMLKAQRQSQLLQLIKENEAIKINDIAKRFGTSMMTIRRDLDELEAADVLKRVHGGAVIRTDAVQPTFLQRVSEQQSRKQAVAREAASRIREGDVVIFDGGTTTLEIVKHIPDGLHFTDRKSTRLNSSHT